MNRDQKRDLLKKKIFDAALKRIEKNGLSGLRARDVALDAGCSLGSLYNAYNDLDDLILHINSQILSDLSKAISDDLNGFMPPEETLISIAQSYLDFAYKNYNLWSSVFGHAMQDGAPIPQWYTDKTNATFLTVVSPLTKLRPDLDEAEAYIMVKTLFSAVHGIVALNLQERFIAIPRDMLEVQLKEFVRTYVKGLSALD